MRYDKLITASTLCLILMITGCASNNSQPTFYTRVNDATLHAGQPIPAPTGDVILTVTGHIGTSNAADGSIQMDLSMIEAVGQFQYTVTDPFDNVDRVFQGPLMTDMLALWQVPSDSTQLVISATDDYVVNVPLTEVRNYPVLFALKQDGQYLPAATRAPAMLVFPYNNYQFDHQTYNDYWAWQIKSIVVQ